MLKWFTIYLPFLRVRKIWGAKKSSHKLRVLGMAKFVIRFFNCFNYFKCNNATKFIQKLQNYTSWVDQRMMINFEKNK